MLSLIFGKINPQFIDGLLDFFDFSGHTMGKFLLVLDDFGNKKLQFIDQVDRKHQGKTIIRY